MVRDADSLVPLEVKASDATPRSLVKMTDCRIPDISLFVPAINIILVRPNLNYLHKFKDLPDLQAS